MYMVQAAERLNLNYFVLHFQETISTGPFVMRSTCRHCYGQREIIQKPCVECSGRGKTVQRKKVVVPVPAGRKDQLSY